MHYFNVINSTEDIIGLIKTFKLQIVLGSFFLMLFWHNIYKLMIILKGNLENFKISITEPFLIT